MEVFYFGPAGRRLFAVLHLPPGPCHTGLVFCPPFGEEMTCTYARLAWWGKKLAGQGIAVLRYHPYGTGESDGELAEFNLEGAGADAVAAMHCLRERVSLERAGFFGLRLGGHVTVQAALAGRPDLLLLWSPVTSPRRYFRELLRLRQTKELLQNRGTRAGVGTQAMIDQLESGQSLDLLGYDLAPGLYRQMNSDPQWPEQPPARDVLWVARPSERTEALRTVEGWRSKGGRVALETLPEPVFWEEFSSLFPTRFATASSRWLAGPSGCGAAPDA